MFRVDECAPFLAAKMAEHEAHMRDCREEVCERCGRWRVPEPPTPEQALVARREAYANPSLATLPAAFDGARLDAAWLIRLVGSAAIDQARKALRAQRVVFTGPAGSGKTSLAVAMFRSALEASAPRAKPAKYLYASAHRLAKARSMHPLGEGEAPLVLEALRADLLLVDELGGEDARYGSAVAEVLYERHAEGLPTWVTTGVGPQQIAERYAGGIARRVFEGAEVFRLGAKR